MRSRASTFVVAGLLLASACGDDGDTGEGGTVALDTGATGPGTSTDAGGDGTAAPTTADAGTSGDPGTEGGTTTWADSTDGSQDATSTGAAPSGPQWAVTEIDYAGAGAPQQVAFDDCSVCDATLDGPLLVRFQQADGWTVWSITIPADSVVGSQPLTADYSGAHAVVNEQNPELDPAYHGFFDATMSSGTLTLTDASIEPGGAVAGTIEAHFVLGGATADLRAEFYAEIP